MNKHSKKHTRKHTKRSTHKRSTHRTRRNTHRKRGGRGYTTGASATLAQMAPAPY